MEPNTESALPPPIDDWDDDLAPPSDYGDSGYFSDDYLSEDDLSDNDVGVPISPSTEDEPSVSEDPYPSMQQKPPPPDPPQEFHPPPSAPFEQDITTESASMSIPHTVAAADWEEQGNLLDDVKDKEAFLEEQRKIMEQIQNETRKSDAELAGILQDEALVEDQLKILKQIRRKERSNNNQASRPMAAATAVAVATADASNNRRRPFGLANLVGPRNRRNGRPKPSSLVGTTVNLGSGKTLAVRGSEETHKAIRNGTAIMARCVSCRNKMWVTDSAQAMACPICKFVGTVSVEL